MRGRIVNVMLISAAALLLTASFSAAQAPNTISYQGRLTDDAGQPITTTVSVTFAIYDTPTGGSVLYTTTQNITPDGNGIFTVELGPIGSTVFNGSKRYLGIKVGADSEMTPRQLLTSGPYSFATNSIGANSITSSEVVNSSLYDVDLADEPGLAFRESTPANIFRPIPTGTNALDSISITVPAAGYVYVWAHTDISVDHVNGTTDEVYFQVAQTAGTITYTNYGFAQVVVPRELPTQASRWYIYPVDAHRPFYVSTAGTYKFYANCSVWSGDTDNDSFFDLQMTAMYFPTAYGAVDKGITPPGGATHQPTGVSE
jgi:hypothetical protein